MTTGWPGINIPDVNGANTLPHRTHVQVLLWRGLEELNGPPDLGGGGGGGGGGGLYGYQVPRDDCRSLCMGLR